MTYDVIASARRRTRRRLTAAAVAVAAVTALGVAAAVAIGDRRAPRTTPTAPAAAGMPDQASAAAVTLPADLRWVPVAGVPLPVSDQSGPRDTTAGLARGFTHDEAGAVLAAVHIIVRVAPQLGPAVFDPTLRTQVVGPDSAALRMRIAQDYDDLRDATGVPYGQPTGNLPATLRGYRLTDYTPQETSLQVLTEATDTRGAPLLAVSTLQLQWTGQDWALLAPPGGDFNAVMSLAANPDDFQPFTPGR